eukprot:CAMPEP_0170564346 /NCGR_PEP_ID=MMETSP0211-20121228/72383_1 /TAXON_ID=311385 /ORGANISM="Pseudokeronopsis sp., Strain OXSARD2" /LENGTH=83 /DNA_ID=CAMNT_0010883689 /DNA_START=467 /DNA_END=718 /DNA_ORIENTATION=+
MMTEKDKKKLYSKEAERSELSILMEQYNIDVNFKQQLLKENKSIYPKCKNDPDGFFKYKKGQLKKIQKKILENEISEENTKKL